MESTLQKYEGSRRLAGAWFAIALVALALSTLCALLLVAARAPLPGMPGAFASGALFGRALALHVSLAVIVWFLACGAGIWTLAAGAGAHAHDKAGSVRWIAPALSGSGLAAMVASLFMAGAQPVLSNYVPVLDHPLFLAGLMLFVAGVALCGAASAAGLLRQWRRGPLEIWRLGALLSIAAAAVALGAFAASWSAIGAPAGHAAYEILAWAPGHVLQFVHVLLMMSVWIVLAEALPGADATARRLHMALLALAALPLLAAPAIYFNYHPSSEEFRRAFTLLMAWALWPAPALLALRLLLQLARGGRAAWSAPQALPLLLSILLFLLGCALGASIRGDSTMVPAHYHGTVGAVTLAYMALGYRLLPLFGAAEKAGRLARWQPVLYGAGLLILALGLAWSGWLGVPRKTLHADVLIRYPAYFAAMGMAGLGGLMGVGGAALFVANVVRAMGRRLSDVRDRAGRRDVRGPALALTLVLTVLCGALFAWWPDSFGGAASVDARKDPVGHVAQKRKDEVRLRFTEGVSLLSEKQYEAAASKLHRVLELAPQMPEAHVNMGFAMIGLAKYEMAREFFEAAISLRETQMNAYYGLAVALEGLGDLEGALGAMRTYAHRATPDDPYLVRANAAIWEWQEQLAKARGAGGALAAIPESGKGGVRYPIPEKKFN